MLWIISCTDKPNTAAIREQVLPPHCDTITRMRKGQWNPAAAEGA